MRPAVRVQADPARLAAYGLSMEDVRTAIAGANVNGAEGRARRRAPGLHARRQRPARDRRRLSQTSSIAYRNGAPVRLSDVGTVVDGLENDRVAAWYQTAHRRSCSTSSASPAPTSCRPSTRMKEPLPQLQQAHAGRRCKLTIVTDRTETIRASVRRRADSRWCWRIVLVVLVVFAVPAHAARHDHPGVALPLSLIGTFGVMYLLGFSLDNLSLMALTIAHRLRGRRRHRDDREHRPPHRGRRCRRWRPRCSGAREIGFTIISLTVSLIAVFIPLLFMTGLVGRLFREFALTLTIAVVVSAVVSLTLTPMMCGAAAAADRATRARPCRRACRTPASTRCRRAIARTLLWVLRHQPLTLADHGRRRWSARSRSMSWCRRASCRSRIPARSWP